MSRSTLREDASGVKKVLLRGVFWRILIIYAKVAGVREYKGRTVNDFRITSIATKDRDVLGKWIQEAS